MDADFSVSAKKCVSMTGPLLVEGKTKKIIRIQNDAHRVLVVSKNDITAGDGARHDILPGKGVWANQTTCNVFRLLASCGVPLAFEKQETANSFIAQRCDMLPLEVVARREAHGSFLKRNPQIRKGHLFPRLIVEFFLKTKDRRWGTSVLPCDDPLIDLDEVHRRMHLYRPTEPLWNAAPFLSLGEADVFPRNGMWELFPVMEETARRIFLLLEKAWQIEGCVLADFKIEFGINTEGCLVLADVIDNDSWRVLEHGAYIDKQVYRDKGLSESVGVLYRRVAERTKNFRVPKQQIILWRGSEKDDLREFLDALGPFSHLATTITCSTHRNSMHAPQLLYDTLQRIPDAVVIAYIGKSNGAGPTLSALANVPVITVPVNVKEFPDDVWSSLRMPSGVPVLTVLSPSNAVLAALNMLSARNPAIYAHVRGAVEKTLLDVVAVY